MRSIRNGTRTKNAPTDTIGPVELGVPRDPAATFDPQIVRERDILGLWAGTGGEDTKFPGERADRPAQLRQ